MRVPFDPTRDAFAFTNGFVDHISIAHIPVVRTRGRCGGMVFAALDYWHNRLPVPDARELPPDGVPLADYIHTRSVASIAGNWLRYLRYTRMRDHPTWWGGIGAARATREEQFPRLTKLLDRGVPQPLCLVRSRDPRGFGEDHQVVAYGYEQEADRARVFIWDNRHGRREDTLEFATSYGPVDRAVHQSDGSTWRGFFLERYSPRSPWYLADGTLLRERSDERVFIVHGGTKVALTSPEGSDQLGLRCDDPVEVPDGSLAYIA